MALSAGTHRLIRIALLLVFAGGVGLANYKLKRTPDQLELTHYVEKDLPPLLRQEQSVADSLQALLDDKKLAPETARKRLVDDIIPRLVKLHRGAEALSPSTLTVRTLAAEYLRVTDEWTDAARTAVHAIDDPKTSTEAGVVAVHERFGEAARASQIFSEHVVSTCRTHRLAPPARQ